jgi:NadR type nicotinamide-nucleotide adenylyltransferase
VKHALIVGKFYPPHLGHQYLISEAARCAEEVTVLVMAARRETIPLADRVAWLREAFAATQVPSAGGVKVVGVSCDAPVDYGDDRVWDAQVAVMRAALARAGRPPVNAVFSSEQYGAELARRFGASHVAVDVERQTVPVSATGIRACLHQNWDWLVSPARTGLAVRIVVLGAESTGTTTVARQLAEHYRSRGGAFAATPCVGEYGREYTAIKWEAARADARKAGQPEPSLDEITWDAPDFDSVAREQTRRENAAAAAAVPLIICDTDAFATSVWERRYLASGARGLQPWAASELPRHDIYLLTTHEGVPWHDDGMREGDLEIRAAMTGWFADALTDAGHSWLPLTGTLAQRSRLAIRAVDLALADRAWFGPSITQLSDADAGRGN